MNEKQGEHLDQRIRQSLAGLPDGPPPGSSFDSARLWEQLRPELVAQPVDTKKRTGGWWLAAASLVGLLVGFWWLSLNDASESVSVYPRSARSSQMSSLPRSVRAQIAISNRTSKPSVRKQKTEDARPVQRSGPSHGSVAADSSIAQESQLVMPESVSLTAVAAIPEPTKAPVSKRRFRVVHENELMAEDEAHRVRYGNEARTERFVRLGNGKLSQTVADEDSPSLMLPLNRKSTQ